MLVKLFDRPVKRIAIAVAAVVTVVSLLVVSLIPQGVNVKVTGGYLSFGLNPPAQAAAVITSLGTAQNKTDYDSADLDITSGLTSGEDLIVVYAGDVAHAGFVRVYYDSGGSTDETTTVDATATNSGSVVTEVFRWTPSETAAWDGTYPYIQVYQEDNWEKAKVFALYRITGLDASPLDKTSTATGSSTSGSSGATATLSQADEVIIGAVGSEDEIDDLGGTWTTGAGYVSGNEQQTGTNGAGDASNISIYSAAEIVSATTAQTATVTGMDSVDWAAAVVTYKVATAGADISNSPSSKALGTIDPSSTYWSNGSEPTWALVDGDAFFTITNNGGTCSITVEATDFTGGVGWNLVSGSPSSNEVRLTVFEEGDGSGDGLIVTNSAQAFIAALSTNVDWEFKLETGTFTDGVLKTSTITLSATLD